MQQLKNYFTMLLLSAGTPMFVMGDEFAAHAGRPRQPVQHRQRGHVGRLEPARAVGRAARLRAGAPATSSLAPAGGSSLLRCTIGARHVVGVAVTRVVRRRSLRDGECLVGTGGVRAAGTRPMGDRPLVGAPAWHHRRAPVDRRLASRLDRAKSPFRAVARRFTLPFRPLAIDPQGSQTTQAAGPAAVFVSLLSRGRRRSGGGYLALASLCLRLDDQRGDHAEHAGRALGVVEDVAVPRPHAGLVGLVQHGVALAGGDVDRVARASARPAARRPWR